MSRILVASITHLCTLDHGGYPAVIASWTANKTEAGVRQMMAAAQLYVAERDGDIAAVGGLAEDSVTLNYVDPDHRRTGVSRALLRAMETELARRGIATARLKSTATARDFYRSEGWIEDAPPKEGRFITAFAMHKKLL